MTPGFSLAAWRDDLRCALSLLTRLPVGQMPDTVDWGRCLRAVSLVGALVGALGGLAFVIANAVGLPPLASALVSLAVTVVATGALHEDGLADVADGFGGGRDKAQKLRIMRDSRLGTYGACALLLSFLLRAAAIAAIAEPDVVVAGLVAAHALARGYLPLVMWTVPLARDSGLAASVPPPRPTDVALALASAAVIALLCLGFGCGLVSLALAGATTYVMVTFARRQIAGYTGDVLGSIEQFAETVVLLAVAAQL